MSVFSWIFKQTYCVFFAVAKKAKPDHEDPVSKKYDVLTSHFLHTFILCVHILRNRTIQFYNNLWKTHQLPPPPPPKPPPENPPPPEPLPDELAGFEAKVVLIELTPLLKLFIR